jgi:Cu/Ag efflux pump CusA
MRLAKKLYAPTLERALHLRCWLWAGRWRCLRPRFHIQRLGAEFIPKLDEGDGILQLIKAQSTVCRQASKSAIRARADRGLPGNSRHLLPHGRAEIATDPMDPATPTLTSCSNRGRHGAK